MTRCGDGSDDGSGCSGMVAVKATMMGW